MPAFIKASKQSALLPFEFNRSQRFKDERSNGNNKASNNEGLKQLQRTKGVKALARPLDAKRPSRAFKLVSSSLDPFRQFVFTNSKEGRLQMHFNRSPALIERL